MKDQVGGWEALLHLGETGSRGETGGGKAARLTAALRAAIADGRLPAGTRLPSTRDLAADLGLSRGVVVGAYEQLVAEGRLIARRGGGTTVATVPASAQPAAEPTWAGSTITALRPGVPDLSMFPRAAWRRAYDEALTAARGADFDYGDPAGAPRLRAELAGYLGRVRAARVTPHALVVTTGAAQAMSLLATVLRQRGTAAIGLEDPGSAAVRGHLGLQGLDPVPVPVDADGLDVRALAAIGLRAVFVTPAHQFPTGVVLAPGRRTELIEWARRRSALIVEDDYDAEFRYDREPVGCLQGVAPDVVALVGSVSKALVPALRLGWLVAPVGWRDALARAKEAADRGGPVVEQLAFARLLATGGYDRHLRRVRRAQRVHRDAVVAAVRRYLPGARVGGVAAGLHLVVELPPGVDDVAVADRARAVGLAPLPLSRLRLRAPGPPGLVLGYATLRPDELTDAVRRLAACVDAGSPASTQAGTYSGGLARSARPSAYSGHQSPAGGSTPP
jgi:GntR family transcriptional regulator/MocR family aminotransferase